MILDFNDQKYQIQGNVAAQIKLRLSGNHYICILIHQMDSKNLIATEQTGQDYYIAQFKTTQLAIFSYYLESDHQCILIDPLCNTRPYLDFIANRHTTLKFVLLTHYHADFIAGHTEFKVPIIMGPNALRAINKFKVIEAKDRENIDLGKCKIQVLHTPGHTLQSSCFLFRDQNNKQVSLFTGDTVFLGDVGRPDLAVSSNITKDDLAELLFESIQRLRKIDGQVRIYPGHGSGSSCGKSIGAGNYCTLAEQMKKNYGFTTTDKKQFIRQLTANMPKPPEYFFFDAHANQTGPISYEAAFKKAHVPLSLEQFAKLKSAYKVIDTRKVPSTGILKGSYWFPESGPIANLISNLVGPSEEIVLVCDGNEEQLIERFIRIGYYNIRGYNNFDISQLKAEFIKPTILKFITLKHIDNGLHLDVRNPPQYKAGGVIRDAVLIPLGELESRVGEVKEKKNIVINCLSGYRSKIAFSILAKHGVEARVLEENFKDFKDNGLDIVQYQS